MLYERVGKTPPTIMWSLETIVEAPAASVKLLRLPEVSSSERRRLHADCRGKKEDNQALNLHSNDSQSQKMSRIAAQVTIS